MLKIDKVEHRVDAVRRVIVPGSKHEQVRAVGDLGLVPGIDLDLLAQSVIGHDKYFIRLQAAGGQAYRFQDAIHFVLRDLFGRVPLFGGVAPCECLQQCGTGGMLEIPDKASDSIRSRRPHRYNWFPPINITMRISLVTFTKFLTTMMAGYALAHSAMAADRPVAPAMISIPQGKIETAACPTGTPVCPEHDYVRQTVDIAPFEIGVTEVTFAEWDACVDDHACTSPVSEWAYENRPVTPPCVADAPCQYPADNGWGRGTRPVINVSWDDVQGYLAWLNKRTSGHYRLPTSAEWEYAALAGATTTFPWGAKLGKKNTNCDGCGSKWDQQTAPVASFKPNKFGVHDMIGNVSEWVSTCFPSRARGSKTCNTYLYRGGAWPSVARSMDPRGYQDLFGNLRKDYIGFRVAR